MINCNKCNASYSECGWAGKDNELEFCPDYHPITNFDHYTRSPKDLAILLECLSHKKHTADMFEKWLELDWPYFGRQML